MQYVNQAMGATAENSAGDPAARLGVWSSILLTGATAASLGIAIATAPARSGPFCLVELQDSVDACVTYPYTDVAAFVPVEYIWMYPALLMGLLFVVVVGCIHHYAPAGKKLFSQIALSFAVMAAATHAINYFIQLAVVQPSLLKGEGAGLTLFSQYNPHGIFIALEDVGYLMMGIAFGFTAVVFGRRERLERVLRLLFLSSSVLAVGFLPYLALRWGSDLEYRYEVAAIMVDWTALIISGVLLSIYFRRAARQL